MTASTDRRNRLAIGICLTTLFVLFCLFPPPLLQTLENKLLDLRFRLRGPLPGNDSVVIAAIDEKSLKALGRWPWSRDVLARLVNRLAAANPSVIAFDVLFPETEGHDDELGAALDAAGNVLLPVVFDFSGDVAAGNTATSLQQSGLTSITGSAAFNRYQPITARQALVPVPELTEMAMGLGHINMLPDRDGVLRWEMLLIAKDELLIPSLPLLTAAAHKGIGPERIAVDATQSVELGKSTIPTDVFGRIPINYYGTARTFPHYSISDLLDGSVPPERLANKIVLIGATAVGIYDLRVTPFSAAMPGVEKHASVIASLLDDRVIHPAPRWLDIGCIAVSGLLLTVILMRTRAIASALTGTALGATIFLGGVVAFNRGDLWLTQAAPLLNLFLITAAVIVYSFRAEERKAGEIRRLFSSYVTERVVNELIRNPEMAKLGGERREITVLFSDIQGFTTFSEKHSPSEVVAILNEYLGAMTEVIFRWEGTLDKFVGDEIMVFWGAPLQQTDHAERALRCALAMRQRLEELQAKWRDEGKPPLEAGIGLNSGEVLVGNIGAEGKKMDYTVIGDHVNLGARVESLTRKFGCYLLLTEHTLKKLRPEVDSGRLRGVSIVGVARVIVKGKEQPVGLYTATTAPDDIAEIIALSAAEEEAVLRMEEK